MNTTNEKARALQQVQSSGHVLGGAHLCGLLGGFELASVLLVKQYQRRANFKASAGSLASHQSAYGRLNAAAGLSNLHLGKPGALKVGNECFPVHVRILFANRYLMQRLSAGKNPYPLRYAF